MAGSRLPRQLFLQGVAAVFMFAFASLYTQIPGLYGPEGILPARRTLRPQGKGRWQQLWETPTLLWEAPLLGLDTAQGLELLSLLGTVLALGALLTRQLRHPLVYLLLWAAYLSVCQVGQVFLYFQWDSLLLETGFLAVLVAPLGLPPNHKQTPQGRPGGVSPHEGLPFWLVRWLLFRLMFASGVVKLTSRCPAWWGLTALTYHYETQCLPTPAAWFAHHLPVWLHKLSVVATFLIEIAVPPLFFAPVRRLRLAAFYSQVLLQVLIIITGNYNFFNLLTLVLTTALLDDTHLAAKSSTSRRKRTPSSWPKALLAMLTLLLELAVYGLLAYGVVHYFGLEVDWEQHVVHSRTTFTFHQLSQWLKMVTLPTMWLGAASLAWELLTALWRWVQVRGSLRKLYAAVQLSVFGTATVALFLISLEIEFMYKPGNLSRPPPIVVPHQPRLDWQMWFAALGPHTHSPWFTSLVLRLLQGKEPVIRLVQNHVPSYPFHQQPPTYVRAQLYKYWFSHPWEQGQWWRRQWVEEFFPSVSLGDPALDMLLRQFGLQDKSPPRARGSSNTLSQALHWVRKQLSPLEAPALLWGLLGAVGAIKVMQALLGPQSLPRTKEEKHKPAPQEDSVAASKQASPAPNISSGSQTPRRKKSP
ncbi:lipase maturation factor 2 isoform X3 [Bubalus bubalis]|uniref:lipase maturation factor 2 isoform X3 n=1 Tax=Bubalus bubalis TaxID=89462 RepID=UPI001D106CC8|nr:lipase maturation factor 2 isoform X3 [Bubalus bubalis]